MWESLTYQLKGDEPAWVADWRTSPFKQDVVDTLREFVRRIPSGIHELALTLPLMTLVKHAADGRFAIVAGYALGQDGVPLVAVRFNLNDEPPTLLRREDVEVLGSWPHFNAQHTSEVLRSLSVGRA